VCVFFCHHPRLTCGRGNICFQVCRPDIDSDRCIAGLRGSVSRQEPVAEPVSTSLSHPLPALITESEHIGDDWLIDDVRGSKRKRPDMESLMKDVYMEQKRNRQQPTYSGRTTETSRVRDMEQHASVIIRVGEDCDIFENIEKKSDIFYICRAFAHTLLKYKNLLPNSSMCVDIKT